MSAIGNVAPSDLYVTPELHRRVAKITDHLREKVALQDIAGQMVDHPEQVLPKLVERAMEMTGAVSAGISAFEEQEGTAGIFRWRDLKGELARFEGATTPRNYSPCGVCLDRFEPTLTRRPERHYTWIAEAGVSCPEVLLVPLYIARGQPLGTLWIVSEQEGYFDSGHARIMRELASFTGIALAMLQDKQRLQDAAAQQEVLRRKAEDALRQAQKMEAIGQLTGGIAHDFNNMLTVLIGSLETVERRLPARAPEIDKALARAFRSANRAATLTHRLLAFAHPQEIHTRSVDVDAVVSGMFDMLGRTLGERIAIEVAPATGVWPIRVDESQLENALLNLAINARDAMPNGGLLKIEATNVTLEEPSLEDEFEVKPGEYVMLCVTDTGTGMSPEVIERVFEPFFTTKGAAGTGLGLSMVYGLVKQAQGHVRIDSKPGEGTSFKLYLPRLREDGEADRPAVLGTQPIRGGSETVLVVEDEPEVRFLYVEGLTELGYEVIEAADARSALALVDERPDIALLLTDLGLPDSSGQHLAAEARRRRPGLPVLMATGYGSHAVGRGETPSAADGIITKPFNSATLGKVVRDVLEGREKANR